MDKAGEGPLSHFLLQDRDGVVLRFARVHDQGQPKFACGSDMDAKVRLLLCARAVLVIVIEAGLADADHLAVPGKFEQRRGICERLLFRFVRMTADGTIDVGEIVGDRGDVGEAGELCSDRDADADARGFCAGHHLGQFRREIGKIEMAVAVDEHAGGTCESVTTRRAAPPSPLRALPRGSSASARDAIPKRARRLPGWRCAVLPSGRDARHFPGRAR